MTVRPMECTFLGQQSWAVGIGTTTVLVDPMLTESFGNSDRVRFEIVPRRTVMCAEMPDISGVIITNEHLDHLHLPSVARLGGEVPVYVPALLPEVSVDALMEVAERVVRVPEGRPFEIGDMVATFLGGRADVPTWENRVHSVLLRPATLQPQQDGGIFIQSDTDPSPMTTVDHLRPTVYVATHNAQVPPDGSLGAFDNLLPTPPEVPAEVTGLDLLDSMLAATSQLPTVRHIMFSGGGYRQAPPCHGDFLWSDFVELAGLANSLSMGVHVHGLRPGEGRVIDDCGVEETDASWVVRADSPAHLSAKRMRELGPPSRASWEPLFPERMDDEAWRLVERELRMLAPLLLLSSLGRRLVMMTRYLGRRPGPIRFALVLRSHRGTDDRVYGLDFNSAEFRRIESTQTRDVVLSIPAGLEIFASDFAAVLEGRIHIWELAVARSRQWYVGERLESPIAFLYGYLSEGVRPDIASRLYQRVVAAL